MMAGSTNTAAPGRFWLVLRDGFTYMECRHASEDMAMQEAKRMTSDFPGRRVYVMECVGFAERPDQVVAVRFKQDDGSGESIDARMAAARVEAHLDMIERKERAMTGGYLKCCPFCAGPVVTSVGGCRPPEIECRPCGVTMSGRPGGVAQLRDRWNARVDASAAYSGETDMDAAKAETKWGIYDAHNEHVDVYENEVEARKRRLAPRECVVEIRIPAQR